MVVLWSCGWVRSVWDGLMCLIFLLVGLLILRGFVVHLGGWFPAYFVLMWGWYNIVFSEYADFLFCGVDLRFWGYIVLVWVAVMELSCEFGFG